MFRTAVYGKNQIEQFAQLWNEHCTKRMGFSLLGAEAEWFSIK